MISQAISIFTHSFKMVLNNLGVAARISIPILILLALFIGLSFFAFITLILDTALAIPIGIIGVFIALVATLIVGSIIAISWHRFVLLGEMPKSDFSDWKDFNYKDYSIQIFKASLIMLLLVIPFIIIISFLGGGLSDDMGNFNSNQLFIEISSFAFAVLYSYIFFRMTIGLPAIAINGERYNFGQSFNKTKEFHGVIFVLSIIAVGVNQAFSWLAYLFPMSGFGVVAIIVAVFLIASSWLMSIVGISVLTTLYGHYIEGRDL